MNSQVSGQCLYTIVTSLKSWHYKLC